MQAWFAPCDTLLTDLLYPRKGVPVAVQLHYAATMLSSSLLQALVVHYVLVMDILLC